MAPPEVIAALVNEVCGTRSLPNRKPCTAAEVEALRERLDNRKRLIRDAAGNGRCVSDVMAEFSASYEEYRRATKGAAA